MKLLQILLTVLLSVAITYGLVTHLPPRGQGAALAPAQESAFGRVMRTGVLRCGYYVFSPATIRDPQTNVLSGLTVDMMNRIGDSAHLKIEWAEEVDFANWAPGLNAGRFDAICTPMWPEPAIAREALFTRPMFYAGINAYARGDDHRFDGNVEAVNDPAVTVVVLESDATGTLAHDFFPKAKLVTLPQNAPAGAMAENVTTKKADILLWDENGVYEYLKANPGGLHNIAPGHPVKVMPFEPMVKRGETDLRDFLDVGVQSLLDTGVMDQLITKWQRVPGSFYPVQQPYIVPAQPPAP